MTYYNIILDTGMTEWICEYCRDDHPTAPVAEKDLGDKVCEICGRRDMDDEESL